MIQMIQMMAGYQRHQPARNTYTKLALSSSAYVIAISHYIESNFYREICTIGWVNPNLSKSGCRTKQQMIYAASYSNVRSAHVNQFLNNNSRLLTVTEESAMRAMGQLRTDVGKKGLVGKDILVRMPYCPRGGILSAYLVRESQRTNRLLMA
jgi:hypothetical protein